MKFGRRVFLAGSSAALTAGMVRSDPVALRRARFEEVGNSVLMTVDVPKLIRPTDRQALASIDSGFATTLTFDVGVFELGATEPITTLYVVKKIQYDLWTQRYVVVVREPGRGAAKRYFKTRDQAVKAALTLDRLRIVRASQLTRGEDGPYYYARIIAQRNPLSQEGTVGADGRTQERNVRWFTRLIDFLAARPPEAEETVAVRTNPFFLLPR